MCYQKQQKGPTILGTTQCICVMGDVKSTIGSALIYVSLGLGPESLKT